MRVGRAECIEAIGDDTRTDGREPACPEGALAAESPSIAPKQKAVPKELLRSEIPKLLRNFLVFPPLAEIPGGAFASQKSPFRPITKGQSIGCPFVIGADYGVSKDKSIDNRFSDAKSTKQGVLGVSVSSDARRLCDLTGENPHAPKGHWRLRAPPSLQNKKQSRKDCFVLERITGLEPATSTLARSRSTK